MISLFFLCYLLAIMSTAARMANRLRATSISIFTVLYSLFLFLKSFIAKRQAQTPIIHPAVFVIISVTSNAPMVDVN